MNLTIENLGFERHLIPLFEKINFQLTAGNAIQILGANGSGKTTLLRILAGFIEPTVGCIAWCGQSVLKKRTTYPEELAYLGHQNGLKAQLTVTENIKLMCALQQSAIEIEVMQSVLSEVGLQHCSEIFVRDLSAGQQRRLSYVRLLLFPKKLWILDEPTTAVDQAGQSLFATLLSAHLKKDGMAIVATHHPLGVNENLQKLQLGVSHD